MRSDAGHLRAVRHAAHRVLKLTRTSCVELVCSTEKPDHSERTLARAQRGAEPCRREFIHILEGLHSVRVCYWHVRYCVAAATQQPS